MSTVSAAAPASRFPLPRFSTRTTPAASPLPPRTTGPLQQQVHVPPPLGEIDDGVRGIRHGAKALLDDTDRVAVPEQRRQQSSWIRPHPPKPPRPKLHENRRAVLLEQPARPVDDEPLRPLHVHLDQVDAPAAKELVQGERVDLHP